MPATIEEYIRIEAETEEEALKEAEQNEAVYDWKDGEWPTEGEWHYFIG
jgi:hypothetical protein